MRNPSTTKAINIKSLAPRMIISTMALALGVLAAFLGLTWFTDNDKLQEFLLQFASRVRPLILVTDISPVDSILMLNDQLYDPKRIYLPGEYTVRVTHDGFYTVEENFRVYQDQSNFLIIRLMPIKMIEPISEYSVVPGWDKQGNLYFLNLLEANIYKWQNNSSTPIANLSGEIFQLVYSPAGTYAVSLASESRGNRSTLRSINLQTGEATDLQVLGYVNLGSDGETIWGINFDTENNGEKPIWRLDPNGLSTLFSLENSQWATFGNELQADNTQKWLSVESDRGIAIWEIASGKMMASFENTSASVWVQNPQPGFAFLSEDNSLNFAQAENDWSTVVLHENIQAPIAAMPGGSEIVFARYNPFAGGTSFWAVDTETNSVRLLSEAGVETGRVKQFSISMDGKKIAFVNQQNTLFLVTLEP